MKSKILMFDDLEMERMVFEGMFGGDEFDVIGLRSARFCVDNIEDLQPDLVLLDVMMPEWDGIEALNRIRAVWTAVELPVIMVTAKGDAEDVAEALRLGANDYITKPFNVHVAKMRIRNHLTISRLSKRLARAYEIETIKAVVGSYNAEIEGPLLVSRGLLAATKQAHPEISTLAKIEKALGGLADTVRRTSDLMQMESVEFARYLENKKMVPFLGG